MTESDERPAGGGEPTSRLTTLGDNALTIALYVAFVMFLLIALSWPLGIFSVVFDGGLDEGGPTVSGVFKDKAEVAIVQKQVGYLWALNWSFYGVIVMPIMAYFGVRVWASMPDTVTTLVDRGMIRDENFKRVNAAEVMARWDKVLRGARLLFILMGVCVFIFVMSDWWTVVGEPILNPTVLDTVKLSDPVREFDWSIASTYSGSTVNKYALLIFGFVAYILVAGFGTAVTWATCLSALYFAYFMCGRRASRRRGWTIVAMPDSTDRRGGFEVFAEFMTSLLCLSLAIAVGCLLMVIQNAYLRDPASGDIATFVFGDMQRFLELFGKPVPEMTKGVAVWLGEPALKVKSNPQIGLGILLYAFTVLLALVVSWGVLNSAAMMARDVARTHAKVIAAELGVTARTVTSRLSEMQIWPLGWLKLNEVGFLVGAIALSLISYRLLIIPLAFMIGAGLGTLLKMVKKRFD